MGSAKRGVSLERGVLHNDNDDTDVTPQGRPDERGVRSKNVKGENLDWLPALLSGSSTSNLPEFQPIFCEQIVDLMCLDSPNQTRNACQASNLLFCREENIFNHFHPKQNQQVLEVKI